MAGTIKTAEVPQALTASEREQLDKLLARASMGEGPATRIGEPYVALTNIMVPRRGDPEKNADLVRAGEIVHLTDDEARSYGPRPGRQIAVVRKVNGPQSTSEPVPRVPPRAMSGRLQGPPADARPDPVGSSSIQYVEPASVPEASEPTAGQENYDGFAPGSQPVDAEDIIPTRTRQHQAQGR